MFFHPSVTVFQLCPILSLAFCLLVLLFFLLLFFLPVPLHTTGKLSLSRFSRDEDERHGV